MILIELKDKLYIIDQHAAHERILYNRFLSQPVHTDALFGLKSAGTRCLRL
ncbi:MAG: hypothetical protein LBV17_11890 [Treponema sp.]|nr:hypothetical protein [Treponema sp.]